VNDVENASHITHVTWGTFSVSVTSGSGIEGCLLKVSRLITVSQACARRHGRSGTGPDGQPQTSLRVVHVPFPNSAAAWQWALEHGYVQRHFTDPTLRAQRLARAVAQPA
jgi:hypothetical protein